MMFHSRLFLRTSLWALSACLLVHGISMAQPPTVEVKQEAAVYAVAWSADGKRLASAGENGNIRITEFPSGKELSVLTEGTLVTGLVFSADGKLLGAKSGAQDGPLSVWDLETQKKLKQLAFKGYACNQLAFTPDAQTLVAAGPGEHMVWNHAKGGGFGSKAGNVPDGCSAAASPDGALLAWCNPQGALQIFRSDQRQYHRMQLAPTTALAFAPNGSQLAAGAQDRTIRLWSVNGPEVRSFTGLRDPAKLLHFSANGKMLAAATPEDPVVRVWEVSSGRLHRRLTTNPAGVRAMALSPDGRSLALASSNRVYVWNVATRELGELGAARPMSLDQLKQSWEDLANTDPGKAEAAFRQLAQAQQHALDFLKEQIRSIAVPPVDMKQVAQRLRELDHPTYQVRERAFQELGDLGEIVQPSLIKYVDARPSLEGERRARNLLDRLQDPDLTPDRLRCLEAIEILEILHTQHAREVLEELSRDSLIAQIRVAAREALERTN